MVHGRHQNGKPQHPPVMRWAVVCLSVFTAGVLTAMYIPDGGSPVLAASGATAGQRAEGAKFKQPAGDRNSVKSLPASPSQETAEPESSSATPVESATESAEGAVSASTPVVPGTTVTILGVGDILVHKEIWAQAQEDVNYDGSDFTQMLAGVAPRIAAADLGVCHMEYPFAPPEGPVTYWPALPAAPWSLATGLAGVGFDTCSAVSNHIQDKGLDGIRNLLDSLDSHGIAHAGSARSEEESQRITMLDVKGVRIAQLAYSWGLYDNGDSWSVNPNDVDRILADAQKAREQGAQIVIVSLHDGEENVTAPDESQVAISEALAAAGTVDLVLGHHTHCVQPVQKIGDMWVAFGHGNLLTAQSRKDPRTADGLITQWTFAADESGRMRVVDAAGIPILNEDFPFRLVDLSSRSTSLTEAEQESWQRTSEAVMSLGADQAGFHLLTS